MNLHTLERSDEDLDRNLILSYQLFDSQIRYEIEDKMEVILIFHLRKAATPDDLGFYLHF